LLFVRDAPTDDLGAAPFLCLGKAFYVEHRGEGPMNATFISAVPSPPEVLSWAEANVVTIKTKWFV
jgi:hypothetical protein